MDQRPAIVCDPTTGLCTLPAYEGESSEPIELREGVEIIYVGDPMCSWCWGISPALHELKQRAKQIGLAFRIVLGGLRPGGGDEWNKQFTDFLRHHWQEIHQRTGQPFNYTLLQTDSFDYDTEPSCRAVVAARTLDPSLEHQFFELVQHYFYVQNRDPKQLAFYGPICTRLGLDFGAFTTLFESEEIKEQTRSEFAMNRQWGVRSFPTILLRMQDQLHLLIRGFASSEAMWQRLELILPRES